MWQIDTYNKHDAFLLPTSNRTPNDERSVPGMEHKTFLLPQGGGGGGVCKIVYITVLNTGKNFQLISELTELSKNWSKN